MTCYYPSELALTLETVQAVSGMKKTGCGEVGQALVAAAEQEFAGELEWAPVQLLPSSLACSRYEAICTQNYHSRYLNRQRFMLVWCEYQRSHGFSKKLIQWLHRAFHPQWPPRQEECICLIQPQYTINKASVYMHLLRLTPLCPQCLAFILSFIKDKAESFVAECLIVRLIIVQAWQALVGS